MNVPAVPFELKQVRLGNRAFEGENNAYVLGTEPGATTTLVDTGVAVPETREQLEAGLAEHGLAFEDVGQVLLTHWHADHVGLAGAIQRAGGATVRAHAADAPIIAQDPDARESMYARTRELLAAWGTPESYQERLLAFLEASQSQEGEPSEVEPFEGGDRFDLGPVELEAVHLPGHTAGLVGFAFDGRDGEELFSGDALLPYYTPNVGGADVRVEGALGKYLDTLAGIIDRGFARAWPGHRGAIIDPSGRAGDIIVHHRKRTERVVGLLAEHGPADPWTVSARLFGDLESIHILHGPGEAYAHLQHLAAAGIVEPGGAPGDGAGGGREYELVDPDPDLDALFPEVPPGARDPDALPELAD